MADGEEFTTDTKPEDILAERERLYTELENIEGRERKEYRTYAPQIEGDLSKGRGVSAQFMESLDDEASLDSYANTLLKTDSDTLAQYYGVLDTLGNISSEKVGVASRLSMTGEDSDKIEKKMAEGNKLNKKIHTLIADLRNVIDLSHTRILSQINTQRGAILAATQKMSKDTISPSTPTLEGALEGGDAFQDPFKTDFDEEHAWQTSAQSSFDLEQKYIDADIVKRNEEKSTSTQKLNEGSFTSSDLQSTPTSIFDPVPEENFSRATITETGKLSLAPLDGRVLRDQQKNKAAMQLEDSDTNNDPLEFTLDDADRRPVSNWRAAQNTSRVVTQADIESKNKAEAAARASIAKDTKKIYQTTPNTFLSEDSELITDDQRSLLNPNDPSQAWNQALNGVRDRELQNAKSTAELVGLLAGKYGNSTFGLGGRKKTGRELAAIIEGGQNKENINYGIQIADRELAHKAQQLQEEVVADATNKEEMLRREVLQRSIALEGAVPENTPPEKEDDITAKKIIAITEVLKKHDLKLEGFLAAIKGETKEDKIKNLTKASCTPVDALLKLFLSATALCVDVLEVATAVPVLGTAVQYLIIIIKYTTLIPGAAFNMLHDLDPATRYIMIQKAIQLLRGKIILLILSSLGELIPVAGPFWPGTSILVRTLNQIKNDSVQVSIEIAQAIKKA